MNQRYAEQEAALAELVSGTAAGFSDAEMAMGARHFTDLVGVGLAAAGERPVQTLAALCTPRDLDGSARIWGLGQRVSLRDAGLVSAYAAHWHDFDDDETDVTMSHLTVTAMTAAAVVGDRNSHTSGAAVLEAYLTGTEVAMVLGKLINPGHYLAGWHATATLGTFAACAAAGRLLGLDANSMRNALGMAASFTAGIRSNFGSDAKPLQVGQAVSNGILAAECAAKGLQSAPGSLFGPQGYVALQGGDLSRVEEAVNGFGRPYRYRAGGMVIKAYPCCTASHTAVFGVLQLLAKHAIAADDIDLIECAIDPAVLGILIYERPRTPTEAKFSLQFALSASAVRGRLGIEEYQQATLADPAVQRLMDRIEVVRDAHLPKGESGISVASRVAFVLRNGSRIEAYCGSVPGGAGNPLSDEALLAKFSACTSGFLSSDRARDLFRLLLSTPICPRFSELVDLFPTVPARA